MFEAIKEVDENEKVSEESILKLLAVYNENYLLGQFPTRFKKIEFRFNKNRIEEVNKLINHSPNLSSIPIIKKWIDKYNSVI